jgi:hypothetical protein
MDSLLVSVGDSGTVLTSWDGVNWTPRNSGTGTDLNSVVWTGSQLVAIGSGGITLFSSDGINWTSRSSGITSILNSLTWTGSLFVAVGSLGGPIGTIHTSPDGLTWTGGSASSEFLNGVTWTGNAALGKLGQLIAVGSSGGIYSSQNGTNWSAKTSGSNFGLRSVILAGNQLVAVGDFGTILTSTEDPISRITPHFISRQKLKIRLTKNSILFTPPNVFQGNRLTATIYSLQGQMVYRVKISGNAKAEYRLPINLVGRGTYLIELKTEQQYLSQIFSTTF